MPVIRGLFRKGAPLNIAVGGFAALVIFLLALAFYATKLFTAVPVDSFLSRSPDEALCFDRSSLASAFSDTSFGSGISKAALYFNSGRLFIKVMPDANAEEKAISDFQIRYLTELQSIITERNFHFADVRYEGKLSGAKSASRCSASIWIDSSKIVSDLEILQAKTEAFAHQHPDASFFAIAASRSLSGDGGMIPKFAELAAAPRTKRLFRMEFYALKDSQGKNVTQFISEAPPNND